MMMCVKTFIVASFCFLITFRVGTLRNRLFHWGIFTFCGSGRGLLHFIYSASHYQELNPQLASQMLHRGTGGVKRDTCHSHPAKITTLTMPLTGLYGMQATLPDTVCRKLMHENNWCLR